MRVRWIFGGVVLSLMFIVQAAAAAPVGIPRGFSRVDSAPGVVLYRKNREYVHVVSVRDGAKLRLLHKPAIESGLFVSFPRVAVGDWWKEWSRSSLGAFSMINGQFFDTSDPAMAPLAFSMKAEGKVYEGYGDQSEYRGQKRMLILEDDRALIVQYDDRPETLLGLHAKDILVGLDPRAAKVSGRGVARTFLGIDKNGAVLILSSSMASQNYATRILRMFGADPAEILMLDGGRSAQLVQKGRLLVPSRGPARELLPQVLGVEAASTFAKKLSFE